MSATRFSAMWIEPLRRMSRPTSILVGFVLLCVAGVFDWLSGPEIALSIVYLGPIALVTGKVGRWPGLVIAIASGGVWLAVELMNTVTYVNPLVSLWNAIMRATVFCLVSILTGEVVRRKRVERSLRNSQEELERRVQDRTAELQALNITLEQRVAERTAEAEERARKFAKSEAELQKQTDILQSILDSMGDGVVVVDSERKLILINPAARRMLHIPTDNTDVRAWLESQETCLPEQLLEQPDYENPLLRAMRGEAVDGAEMCLRHKSFPEGIWLAVTGRPLLDATRQISGGVIVLSDITARRNLERQIAEVSDREQRRIGEDLHDGLCQHLVSVAFAARGLAARLSSQSLPEAEDVGEIAELLGESISQARDVARGLYLVQLEVGGLTAALDELASRVRAQHRIACQFVERISVPIIGEVVMTNLFRIAQEAVNNAIKHAHARLITITLSADDEQICLSVEDDGIGFPKNREPARGMGFQIMNNRTRMMGAAFNIGPRSGGGTIVTCLVRRVKPVEQIARAQ